MDTGTALVPAGAVALVVPAIIARAGGNARFAYGEFFGNAGGSQIVLDDEDGHPDQLLIMDRVKSWHASVAWAGRPSGH